MLVIVMLAIAQRCGSNFGSCNEDDCCSEYGWCGTMPIYCESGCQAAFGQCGTTTTTTPSSSTSSSATQTPRSDGQCGPSFANVPCPSSQCCSEFGWCGTDNQHCGTGCLYQCSFTTTSLFASSTAIIPTSTHVLTTTASASPTQTNIGYWPPQLEPATNCVRQKTVALTFDDGPDPVITAQVMAAAKAQTPQIPLLFFQIGENVDANPDISANVKNLGFSIGDHSYSHLSAIDLSDAEITQQASEAYSAINAATGLNPQFFRPPYGEYTPAAMTDWYNLGYYVVNWSIDSNDWMDPANSDAAYNNILTALQQDSTSGHIILCHDIHRACKDAFPRIINLFRSKGYSFVTLEECLGISAYK